MGKITELLTAIKESMTPEGVKSAFQARLKYFNFDNDVAVDSVEFTLEGEVIVTFVDMEDGQLDVLFDYDEDEGVTATIIDGEDDEEYITIDLDALSPSTVEVGYQGVKYPKLDNLSWMNKSALSAILTAGDIDSNAEPQLTQDDVEARQMSHHVKQFNYFNAVEEYGEDVEIDEATAVVVRNGKKVRLAIVRKKRRKRLTAKQRMARKKAARTRKRKATAIKRKLKRSLGIRKRQGLKAVSRGKYRKVAGTADRKR